MSIRDINYIFIYLQIDIIIKTIRDLKKSLIDKR